jgi:predicted ester cyclase
MESLGGHEMIWMDSRLPSARVSRIDSLTKIWRCFVSTQDCQALVGRYFNDILNNKNSAAAAELLAPVVVVNGGGWRSEGGVEFMQGSVPFRFNKTRRCLPDLAFTVDSIASEGTKVAACWTAKGTHSGDPIFDLPPLGKQVEVQGISLFHVTDGKIGAVWSCEDQFGLAAQLTTVLRDTKDVPDSERFAHMPAASPVGARAAAVKSSLAPVPIVGTPLDNKDVIKRYCAWIMNGQDLDKAVELISAECAIQNRWRVKPTVGPERWVLNMRLTRTGFPDLIFTEDDILAAGDVVVARFTGRGTSKNMYGVFAPTGKAITMKEMVWFRVNQGKITEIQSSLDRLTVFGQLGALPALSGGTVARADNIIIMREFFEGIWNRADYSLIDQYVSKDMIQHIPGEGNGPEGFRATAKRYHAGFSEMNLMIQDEMADGDRVVHRWVWECTHTGVFNGLPATGKKVRFTGVTIVRVANGLMVEHWSEVDVVSLLQQLGVMPRPGG